MIKNLCFFTGSQGLAGGTERACADVANTLDDAGYSVTILSQYNGCRSSYTVNNNVKLKELSSERSRGIIGYFKTSWKAFLFVVKNRPDALIAVESQSFLFLILCFFLPSRPAVINWEHFNASINLGRVSRSFARRLAAKFADYIVVLSDYDLGLWENNLGTPTSKLRRIYNLNPYDERQSELPVKSFKDGSLSLIAVGRLTEQKGFDLLVDAWARIPAEARSKWHLKIFGEGPDRVALSQKIAALGLDDEVFLAGQCNDIAQEYMKADIFVLPSRFEGFGLVLVEALSFGLPVISFDCPAGPAEILHDGVNGLLVPPSNIDELANALTKFMNDDSVRADFASKTHVGLERFSSSAIREQWQDLIRHC